MPLFFLCSLVQNVFAQNKGVLKKRFPIKSLTTKMACLIEDNGKGFDIAGSINGYGLENMKYRAAEMNLSVQSQPGKGTVLSIYN